MEICTFDFRPGQFGKHLIHSLCIYGDNLNSNIRIFFALQVHGTNTNLKCVFTHGKNTDPSKSQTVCFFSGMGYEVRDMGYEVRDMGYEVWDMGYEVWDMGFEVWDMGFEVWDMGFEVWGMGSHFSSLEHQVLAGRYMIEDSGLGLVGADHFEGCRGTAIALLHNIVAEQSLVLE